jgi:hypothetical protein
LRRRRRRPRLEAEEEVSLSEETEESEEVSESEVALLRWEEGLDEGEVRELLLDFGDGADLEDFLADFLDRLECFFFFFFLRREEVADDPESLGE